MQSPLSRWRRRPSGAGPIPRCHVVDLGGKTPADRRIAVEQGETVRLVPLDAILWIVGKGGVIRLHLIDGELTTTGALDVVTRALGPTFQRINRNTTVSLAAVKEVRRRSRRGESAVVLQNGPELQVTRSYTPALRAWLTGGSSASQGSRRRS